MTICPILLAAGQSRRFGGDKLLYSVYHHGQHQPLILHTLSSWLAVFSELHLVIRAENHALRHLLESCAFSSSLRFITATDAHLGMGVSLSCGIRACQTADGWLIGLADMPYIDSAVIRDSLWALQNGATITQAEFEGRRGHPVGFAARFLPELLALNGDKGARDIIASAGDLVTLIPSSNEGIYRDIDVRDDIQPLLS
jgi:molybdenum cofactor cytidylyltransferase